MNTRTLPAQAVPTPVLVEGPTPGQPAPTPVLAPPDLRELTDTTPPGPASPSSRKRPVIQVTSNPDAIRTLRRRLCAGLVPDTYVADGHLVVIEAVSGPPVLALGDDAPLPVRATAVGPAHLAGLLARHVNLCRQGKDDTWPEWTPSQQVLSAVLAGSQWPGLNAFTGFVGMPVLRSDGTLLQTPGYDSATGLVLAPTVHIPQVPARPDRAQVAASRKWILRTLLGDFEWSEPADRANYLALLVTQFVRRYLRCPTTPMGVITATMPGSGKSLLCAIIGLLAGQKQIVLADDDAELEKRISAVFTAEAGTVIFDNLPEGTTIASPILANLLTNPVWSGRILGSTRTGSWPNDRLWLATGNNLAVGGDMARRSVYVRLEPRAPHPEERTGFAIPDLPQRILDPRLRSEILWHLLVLVLDWTHHGSPRDETAPTLGGYAPWTHGIGGLLAHHRIEGFLGNLAATRAEDTDDERWAAFLATWYRKYATTPIKAVDLFRDAQPSDLGYGQPVDPWDGTFITVRDRPPRSSDQLGVWLRGHIGRFHGDYVLRRDRDPHTKASYWRVELAQNTSEPSATLRNPPHEGFDLR